MAQARRDFSAYDPEADMAAPMIDARRQGA